MISDHKKLNVVAQPRPSPKYVKNSFGHYVHLSGAVTGAEYENARCVTIGPHNTLILNSPSIDTSSPTAQEAVTGCVPRYCHVAVVHVLLAHCIW